MAKKKSGRYERYQKEIKPHLKEIEELVSEGYTEASIAKRFGIAECTFNKYKAKYPELMEHITRGRKEVESLVINALLKSALGHKEVTTKTTMKGVDIIETYYPPNIKAIEMILRNYSNWSFLSGKELEFKERELKIKELLAKEKIFEGEEDE